MFSRRGYVIGAAVALLTCSAAVGAASLATLRSVQAGNTKVRTVGYWTEAASLAQPAVSQTAILLSGGDVLVMGGEARKYGAPTRTVQRYHVASGKWNLVAPMHKARIGEAAVLLRDGRVLVVGGLGDKMQTLSSAEVYDPNRNVWIDARRLPGTRFSQTASTLADGRVLIVGGIVNGKISRTTLLFNPRTLSWKSGPSTIYVHAQQDTVTLPHGLILVAGGYGGSAELFDPATGRWTAVGGPRLLAHPVLARISNGSVLFASGVSQVGQTFASTSLFDPKTHKWSTTGSLATGRDTPIGVELRDGRVLVAGGSHNRQILKSAELYDPRAKVWEPAGPLRQARSAASALVLRNSEVLACGGTWFGSVLNSCELYHPQAPKSHSS